VILAEKALGIKGITKAVISVPAYFNAKRIQATKGILFVYFSQNISSSLKIFLTNLFQTLQ